jgi:hypothetical protein
MSFSFRLIGPNRYHISLETEQLCKAALLHYAWTPSTDRFLLKARSFFESLTSYKATAHLFEGGRRAGKVLN